MLDALKTTVFKLLWACALPLARAFEPETLVCSAPCWGACLIVAPHPDDETLACGAVALRLRKAGVEVHVALTTDGDSDPAEPGGFSKSLGQRRRQEMVCACACLGIEQERLHALGYHDGTTLRCVEELTQRLARLIEQIKPALIFSPSPEDRHPDHRAAGLAIRLALERLAENDPTNAPMNAKNEPKIALFEYIVWLKPSVLVRLACQKRLRFIDAAPYNAQKHRAFQAHASQQGDSHDSDKQFWSRYFGRREFFAQA